MGLRNSAPVKFSPGGLSDALDGSNVFPGACQSLVNLIPDPTTKNVWMCRPAARSKTAFAGFTTPGFVSVQKVIGSKVFGMIASGRNAGHDEPFIYDLSTNAFITITGITSGNTPVSPNPLGAWTPPTMDLIGAYMIVTHPGYTGGGGMFFGWFDLTNPAAPAWNAGNTGTNALPAVPTAVKQFNGRAYYVVPNAVAPGTYWSAQLVPLTITNGTDVLTYDDSLPITGLGALPLNNQLGGMLQSLVVFKEANIYQVKGDAASLSNPLTRNSMNSAVGTLSPNAVCSTPKGLAFLAVDGVRVIDFTGNISDPLGFAGMGVTMPFINIVTPSRAAAACNANTFRISVDTALPAGTANQEFWFDIGRAQWCGPHTFPAATIQPYSKTFIMTALGVNANLWQSDSVQDSASTFIENGVQLSFAWQTANLPDLQQMSELNVQESSINVAGTIDNTSYTMQAINSDGAILDTTVLSVQATVTRWGSFTWGQAVWSVSVTGLTPIPINWHYPIVFRKLSYKLTGFSYAGFKIGDMFMRYEQLGYLQMVGTG